MSRLEFGMIRFVSAVRAVVSASPVSAGVKRIPSAATAELLSVCPLETMNLKAVRAKRDYRRAPNNRTDLVRATGDNEVFVKGTALTTAGTGLPLRLTPYFSGSNCDLRRFRVPRFQFDVLQLVHFWFKMALNWFTRIWESEPLLPTFATLRFEKLVLPHI